MSALLSVSPFPFSSISPSPFFTFSHPPPFPFRRCVIFSLKRQYVVTVPHLLGPTVLANNVGPKLILSFGALSFLCHTDNCQNRRKQWCCNVRLEEGETGEEKGGSSIREPFTLQCWLYIAQNNLPLPSPATLLYNDWLWPFCFRGISPETALSVRPSINQWSLR